MSRWRDSGVPEYERRVTNQQLLAFSRVVSELSQGGGGSKGPANGSLATSKILAARDSK